MSGLNASLGYFISLVALGVFSRVLPRRGRRLAFVAEAVASVVLAACWLEVQTIVEVGQWAGGLGPDVCVTVLLVVLLTHGAACGDASGNPALTLLRSVTESAGTLCVCKRVGPWSEDVVRL